VKRKDLKRQIMKIAKLNNVTVEFTEGGNHEHCRINGHLVTVLPRHTEVNELTAREILKDIRKAATE